MTERQGMCALWVDRSPFVTAAEARVSLLEVAMLDLLGAILTTLFACPDGLFSQISDVGLTQK